MSEARLRGRAHAQPRPRPARGTVRASEAHGAVREGDLDVAAALADYIAARHHIDPLTGLCRPLTAIARDLAVGVGCIPEAAVRQLTGATLAELRGLTIDPERAAVLLAQRLT